ncbi:MAG: glycogen debranching protein GlgX [Elusimicrobia bacterium]|nr:glycogen debranching protein GlgX [Elusimicrobiota bacterium]
MAVKNSPGRFYPLGATLAPEGVNFALYSKHAEGVELALFDDPAGKPSAVVRMEDRTRFVWHAFVAGAKAGQLYGYRVHGPFQPERGLRFNEHKLLMDPYAKAMSGKFRNTRNCLLGYDPKSRALDLSYEDSDNSRLVPKSIVVDDAFDWQGVARPETPLESLIIYEAHLKGFTANRNSGVRHPGTYLGFIDKIGHLKKLGVNAVELLPVHEFYVEDHLREKGLTNYWGYNTVGFFAPESSYAAGRSPGGQVGEFKTLVRELHRAGIEVILDVVYNHTGEGNELGPTLSFRGIDNPSYYSLSGPREAPGRHYHNFTGCGNALNAADPAVVRLIMDSLRYWVKTMRVDGFRFDLASVLGREAGGYDKYSAFFTAVAQDPVLSAVKLIAEPWDLGTCQVGNFPVDWSEWNGRFRDAMRRFGKGDGGMLREVGWRITGSADLYGEDGRSAYNSINFTTCHDGFTLHDLHAYDAKHNGANGEGDRDGTDDNNSWNCGVEGPTADPEVLALRRRLAKNQVCFLLFSCGTPMLLGGDEFLRTQAGNNNTYCQDNELGWFDWDLAERNSDFTEFVAKAIAMTRRYPVLQRRRFLVGHDPEGNAVPDIAWFGPDGKAPRWGDPEARTACFMLEGPLYFIYNCDFRLQHVNLPAPPGGGGWRRVIDTSLPPGRDFARPGAEVALDPPGFYLANPRTVVVLTGG